MGAINSIKKLAAIDIGSNAVRLLIMNVTEDDEKLKLHKEQMVRMPVRLGADVFSLGKITEQNMLRLSKTLKGYKELIEVCEIESYRCCATSATREAINSTEVIEFVKNHSGVSIDLISGAEEAELIFKGHLFSGLSPKNNYLYIDVGGGSTEVTFFNQQKIVASKSFNLGTLRMKESELNEKSLWVEIKGWIEEHIPQINKKKLFAVGTGGNINKLYKLANLKENKMLKINQVETLASQISILTPWERVHNLGLRPDRADVIVIAATIFKNIMQWAKTDSIYVPKIGLADGIVLDLYLNQKNNI
jgi:exopolyphosphatase/guanosine-5'-triphosphate,3'-diphosphate pyrophosphatase